MVETRKLSDILIPLFLSLLFILVFYYFGLKYLLACVVGVLGLGISMVDIKYGIYGVTLAMPFLPNSIAIVAFLGLGMIFILNRVVKGGENLYSTGVLSIILIYLVLMIIQTITSLYPIGSVRDLGIHISGIIYIIVLINSIETKEDLNTFLTVLLTAAVLVTVIGLAQSVVGVEIQREWVDTESNIGLTQRIYSVFGNPNIFAEYLVFVIPIGVALFWETKDLSKKIVFGISVAMMFVAIGMTMSRGGWLGIGFAALVYVILVDRRLLLMVIPIMLAGLMFLPRQILNRIISIGNLSDSSNDYRLKIWEITRQIIKDYPIAGLGLGHKPFMETFNTYIRTMPIFHAHNTYLQLIVELGWAGFTIVGMFLYILIKNPIKYLIMKTDDSYIKYITAGVISALAGVLVHGLVEVIFYLPKIIFMFWTMVGVLIILDRIERVSSTD